jgi:putative colanic acid biosynthesis acetyltransferase WcaB
VTSVSGGGHSAASSSGAMRSFEGFRGFLQVVRRDLRANKRDPKSQMILVGFRTCQLLMRDPARPARLSLPAVALYRFYTEFILGMELRPRTRVGPGLTIYHCYGLVVNDQSVIGADVVLRNGVVIGHVAPGRGAPVVESGVEIGAGALLIGNVTVGSNARIGAGAVVVRSVDPGDTVVGNPARSVRH